MAKFHHAFPATADKQQLKRVLEQGQQLFSHENRHHFLLLFELQMKMLKSSLLRYGIASNAVHYWCLSFAYIVYMQLEVVMAFLIYFTYVIFQQVYSVMVCKLASVTCVVSAVQCVPFYCDTNDDGKFLPLSRGKYFSKLFLVTDDGVPFLPTDNGLSLLVIGYCVIVFL